MILDCMDFNNNYNFLGVFWFDNEFDNRFSGTLEYTPERGIKLSLISTTLNKTSFSIFKETCAIQKMYGNIQFEKKSIDITLLDVLLEERSRSYGDNGCSIIIEGVADMLVLDAHLEKNKIKSLNLEYDDNFKSIFFYSISPEEVVEIQPYIKNPIKLSNANIVFDVLYSQTPLYNANQIEDILCDTFCSNNKSSIKELKTVLAKFLKNHKHDLGIRKKTRSIIRIKGRLSNISKYIEIENKWRSFFELIIDKPISIKSATIGVGVVFENGKYTTTKTVLFQQHPLPVKRGINRHKYHLPITADTFLGKNNLSKLQEPYEKWNRLYDDKKWKIIINGIKAIIYKNTLIGNEDFIILISYIETVLNILGYKKNDIDQLISRYADNKWKRDVDHLLCNLPKKETMGKKISELRNAIVHPKSAEKEQGKYFAVITDYILIQKIYGYLAGLFIKMILLYLYPFNKENLEKYIDYFIIARSGIRKIKYNKDYASYKNKLKNKMNGKKKKSTQHSK